jgi:hypothetical protein
MVVLEVLLVAAAISAATASGGEKGKTFVDALSWPLRTPAA